MKPSLASCWYPFRSPEVRAIYENLTPDEASQLQHFSRKTRVPVVATYIGLLMFAVSFVLIQYVQQPWGLAAIFAVAIILGIIGLIGGAPIRSKTKKILCESTYAKEKGYTPETLRLYSLGR